MLGGTTSTCAGKEIWSASLTVGSTGPAGSRLLGYRVTPGPDADMGALSDDTVTLGSDTWTVTQLYFEEDTSSLRFPFSNALIRSRSSFVGPGRQPWSRSACRTHLRRVSAEQPTFDDT